MREAAAATEEGELCGVVAASNMKSGLLCCIRSRGGVGKDGGSGCWSRGQGGVGGGGY